MAKIKSSMLCATGTKVRLCLIFVAVLGSVCGSPEVMISSSPYSCCESSSIPFDPHCENTWSLLDKPIAHSIGVIKDCIFPCKNIDKGMMTLHGCIDVNATITCTNEMNVIEERNVHYYGRSCSLNTSNEAAAVNHGCVGLLLLAVVVTGWFGTC